MAVACLSRMLESDSAVHCVVVVAAGAAAAVVVSVLVVDVAQVPLLAAFDR